MKKQSLVYLLAADSHLAGGEAEKDFFDMLGEAAKLPPSCGIVFLGDIFELWIALARYEGDSHRHFLEFCRAQKKIREILFTEGNHEFYLPCRRADAFDKVSRKEIRRGQTVFTHGDRVNRKDIPYSLLRLGIRNPLTRLLLFLAGPLFGPVLAHKIRLSLKETNLVHKKEFPLPGIHAYLKNAARRGVRDIFIGHFHGTRDFGNLETEGARLHALPSFQTAREVAWCDPRNGDFQIAPWRTVLLAMHDRIQGGDV